MQRRFKSDIRTLFTNAAFTHVSTRDEEFTFEGRKGEIDGIYLYDNVIVLVEETTHSTSQIGDHFRKKAELFKHFSEYPSEFVPFLSKTFPDVEKYFSSKPHIDVRQYVVRYVYCSRFDVDESYRTRYDKTCSLLQYGPLQYFLRLGRTIRKSARYEVFKFLGLELSDIVGPSRVESHTYHALLLPEVPSGFPTDYRLVSFLIDPHTLIERAYVLRADSWRDQEALYQRLLVKGKIGSMREYLVSEQRVFVNNVIVSLPSNTEFEKIRNEKRGRFADEITSGELRIPRNFNTIGIIDGQHRVFAYHEGEDKFEPKIAVLRDRQHLLVTGIIYPANMSATRAYEFEARLFLEINDKQKRVRGDLKQSIQRIVKPYSAVAIAKSVIERMASTGPLTGMLEVHFFDVGKIKTASIVSYGLRHIVATRDDVSLFQLWRGAGKTAVRNHSNKAALNKYVEFAAMQLNMLVAGFRSNLDNSLWTTNRKISRALSATTINGLVFCMRKLIENKKVGDSFEYYQDHFGKMSVDFRPENFPYKSSHWRALGDKLYQECFA